MTGDLRLKCQLVCFSWVWQREPWWTWQLPWWHRSQSDREAVGKSSIWAPPSWSGRFGRSLCRRLRHRIREGCRSEISHFWRIERCGHFAAMTTDCWRLTCTLRWLHRHLTACLPLATASLWNTALSYWPLSDWCTLAPVSVKVAWKWICTMYKYCCKYLED